jgi:hypothetical protein
LTLSTEHTEVILFTACLNTKNPTSSPQITSTFRAFLVMNSDAFMNDIKHLVCETGKQLLLCDVEIENVV